MMKICIFNEYEQLNLDLLRKIANKLGGYTEIQAEYSHYYSRDMYTYFLPSEYVNEFATYKIKNMAAEMEVLISDHSLHLFKLSLEQREMLITDPDITKNVKVIEFDNSRYSIIQVNSVHGKTEMLGR